MLNAFKQIPNGVTGVYAIDDATHVDRQTFLFFDYDGIDGHVCCTSFNVAVMMSERRSGADSRQRRFVSQWR